MAGAVPSASSGTGGSAPPIGVGLPSWQQVLKLARYQLRDYLLSRRFILMIALVVAIGGILTAVVAYFRPAMLLSSSGALYSTIWGGGVTYVIIFAGIIFGGDAIAGEFQNKTGYFLMGLPIRRSTVYAGKYISAFLAATTAVVLFAVLLLANGTYYFGLGAFTEGFAASFALAIVYLLALLGAVFLFSSLFKTSTYATLIVAVLFLFGFAILQLVISSLLNTTPWYLLTYADTVIGGVFNTSCDSAPGTHVCSSPGPGGTTFTHTVTNASIPQGVGIMLAYFLITTVLGLLFFEREEFT